MPIIEAELREYRSEAVNETGANGGRLSATEVAAATKNNVWPDVPLTERTAGSVKWRKTFQKVANAAGVVLQNARVWLASFTAGGDRVHLVAGTQRDTQADLTGNLTLYGCGALDADVSAGAGSLAVLTEAGADVIFRAGETIWISDGANEEFATLGAGNGAVSYAGDVATLTLAGNLTNGYAAATPTLVASVLEAGNVTASADNYAESTTSGTFDEVGNPITVDAIGGVEQTWTLTFTSASAFSVAGDQLGSVGSGNITTDFSPTNPDFSREYFTVPAAAWGGTWAPGETLVWQTHPAAIPTWLRRTVPPGTGSLVGNQYTLKVDGDSA